MHHLGVDFWRTGLQAELGGVILLHHHQGRTGSPASRAIGRPVPVWRTGKLGWQDQHPAVQHGARFFLAPFQGSGVGGRGRGVEHGASVPSTTAPQPGAAGEVGRGSPWDWALAPLSLAMGD